MEKMNNSDKFVPKYSILKIFVIFILFLVCVFTMPMSSTATQPEFNFHENYLWGYNNSSAGLPTKFAHAVWFGDVNNDGKVDIAATRGGCGIFGVWLNVGNGSWTNSSTGLPTDYTGGVCLGDLNNDGSLDLVATDYYYKLRGVCAWFGDGTGKWTKADKGLSTTSGLATNGVYIADVNNDGNSDIIFGTGKDYGNSKARGVECYLGDGKGNWTRSSTGLPHTGSYFGVWAGDVDNDNKIDIVAGGGYGNGGIHDGVHIWKGDGTGKWAKISRILTKGQVGGVYLCDFTNDGNLDVVFTCTGRYGVDGIYAYRGDGTGSNWINMSNNLPMTGKYWGVWVADMNNDGFIDILAAGQDLGIKLYLGNGGTQWTDVTASMGLPTSDSWYGICAGDVDNNGYLDIAIAGRKGVQVWKDDHPIPNFSTIFIPCSVMIALFILIRIYRRKSDRRNKFLSD
jgi:hypothetical protein